MVKEEILGFVGGVSEKFEPDQTRTVIVKDGPNPKTSYALIWVTYDLDKNERIEAKIYERPSDGYF